MTPQSLSVLPPLNALLNATSAICLVTGYRFIRAGRREAHRRAMLTACAASAIFLVSYLTYHSVAGVTRFAGTGWSRPVYFTILVSHTILAVTVLPLVIAAVYNALRSRFAEHRRVARWAFPIWLYVSVTGVLVYLFLYQFFPSR